MYSKLPGIILQKDQLTYKRIFLFWMPLAATWLMMAIEGPFIAAVIARMADPKFNLAAYGVAYSLAIIVEAPIIMILSAATALVKNRASYCKLRNFTRWANLLITLFMLLLIIPPLFFFLMENVIGLPHNIAELTHYAVIILLPWPAAIGFRRFYQGILIVNNETRKVAYSTVVRLAAMGITAILLFKWSNWHGVVVGAAALSIGVVAEAISVKLMALGAIKKTSSIIEAPEGSELLLDYKSIYKFYYPMALTALISLAVHPMVTFFIGQSRMAIESLAVLPVVNSLVFIFRSLGLSYQEVIIALIGDNFEGYRKLKKFAVWLAVVSTSALLLISFTPLSEIWYYSISGLSIELTNFAIDPTKIMAFIPALTVLIAFQRSILVQTKNTSPLTLGTTAEVAGIIVTLFLLVNLFNFVGVMAAVVAFVVGRICSNTYFAPPVLKAIKNKSSVAG